MATTETIAQTWTNGASSYCKMPDGTMIQWGSATNTAEGFASVTYPQEFINTSVYAVATPKYGGGGGGLNCRVITQANKANIIVYFRNLTDTSVQTDTNQTAVWIAVGRWK